MPVAVRFEIMTIKLAPRDYSLEPEGFGKAFSLRWKPADSVLQARYIRAAQMQHQVSLTIALKLRSLGQTRREYAEAVEMSYDRVTKILRGDSLMHLEDIAAADKTLFSDEPEWIAGGLVDLSRLHIVLKPLDSRLLDGKPPQDDRH